MQEWCQSGRSVEELQNLSGSMPELATAFGRMFVCRGWNGLASLQILVTLQGLLSVFSARILHGIQVRVRGLTTGPDLP